MSSPSHVTPVAAEHGEWLFLVHQLPASAANGRVKTWRRLQDLGAVWLRNAAYVLPNSAQAREDFMWLRGEIAGLGGAASIVVGNAIDDIDRRAIMDAFTAARSADYAALERQIHAAARSFARKPSPGIDARRLRRLTVRLREIEQIDFFSASAGDAARHALRRLEEAMPGSTKLRKAGPTDVLDKQRYQRHTWVTRRRPGVDRMSSAWLIRRFIDPDATFAFSDGSATLPPGQIAFDMFQGEFTHEGEACTFEVIVRRFGIEDPAVERLAAIVHDLDLKDHRYEPPEAPTVGTLIEGIRQSYPDDHQALNAGIQMFEGLYRAFETHGADHMVRPRKASRAKTSRSKRTQK
jgi:hypothetical protein